MSYVAFDISERIIEALIATPAIPAVAVVLASAVPPRRRSWLRRTAWRWLFLGGLLWATFTAFNEAGVAGLFFGCGFGVGMVLAALAARRRGSESVIEATGHPRVGTVTAVAAAIVLAVTANGGSINGKPSISKRSWTMAR